MKDLKQDPLFTNSDDLTSKYFSLTSKLAELFKEKNVPIRSDASNMEPAFREASPEIQANFLKKIQFYYDLCVGAIQEDIELIEDKRFLWYAFKQLGMRPPSDLMNHIDPKDHIEVYDAQGVQVFANFEFCRLIAYSIEEIFLFSWDQLFGREQKYTDLIMAAFAKSVTVANGPFHPEVPRHTCWELRLQSKRQAVVDMKMFCPIFDQSGRRAYMIATSHITLQQKAD